MSDLIPTPITDKNGVQTTRNKRPTAPVNHTRDTASAPKPAVRETVMFRDDWEAQQAAYAIPADSAILRTRVEKMTDLFSPDEDDELTDDWEAVRDTKALEHARSTLWIDYMETFAKKLGTHGESSPAKDVAEFIVSHKDEVFGRNNSFSEAVDEFLGL